MLNEKKIIITLAIIIFSIQCKGMENNEISQSLPLDPISSVLSKFEDHDIVALGEGEHNNEQGHYFRLELINDPNFSNIVNDIVVEFGSSSYQDIMDRYIKGEQVDYIEFRKTWLNTTAPHMIWDVPIYEAFFAAVRKINKNNPSEKKVRVLLSQPAFDWSKINNRADFLKLRKTIDRDLSAVDIIKSEVLDKGRKALIIFGEMHFIRKHLNEPVKNGARLIDIPLEPVNSIVTMLEQEEINVFSVWTNISSDLNKIQKSINNWRKPSLSLLKNTALGSERFSFYYPYAYGEGKYSPDNAPKMQEMFDSILYLGEKETITLSNFPTELCKDKDYMDMRLRRLSLMGWENRLKRICKIDFD